MNSTHSIQNPSYEQKARILDPSRDGISQAVQAILQDELVGLPTETVYGLAGNAYSQDALTKIFSVKERPVFDPLILHVPPEKGTLNQLETAHLIDGQRMTLAMKKDAEELMKSFWPGPLTLVLPKHPEIHDLATSGLSTVALRVPRHPVAQEFLRQVQVPLAAPSANRFGRVSPTSSQAVFAELGDRILWILEGGACEIGLESTIVGFTPEGDLQLLRPGGVPKKEIEKALNKVLSAPSSAVIQAPGMLLSHYAPKKPLWLLSNSLTQLLKHSDSMEIAEILSFLKPISPDVPIGFLTFSGNTQILTSLLTQYFHRPVEVLALSEEGNLNEAAHHLFRKMRQMDESTAYIIFSEPCPSELGLGHAITDRLQRAKTFPQKDSLNPRGH